MDSIGGFPGRAAIRASSAATVCHHRSRASPRRQVAPRAATPRREEEEAGAGAARAFPATPSGGEGRRRVGSGVVVGGG